MKFTILTNNVDTDGELILPNGIINHPDKPILLTHNFSHDQVLGEGKITINEDSMGFELISTTPEFEKFKDLGVPLYAVVGGVFNHKDIEEVDGKRIIHKCNITEISITHNPADKSLPPINFDQE